jgi:hypothetical protein
VALPPTDRPSKRLEAILFSPGLDTFLSLHDVREALERARERIAALEAELTSIVQARSHLLFAWAPGGYELRQADGPAPERGSHVEGGVVVRVGPSPLPADRRRCAYVSG